MKNYAALEGMKRQSKDVIECAFNKGYSAGYKDAYELGKKDGQKAERMLLHDPIKKDLEEAYQKGLKHGQELRAEEVKCAEACGMKRAWEAARKIVLTDEDGGIPNYNIPKIYNTSYYGVMKNIPVQEAIAKLDAWEKKQEQSKKCCKDCNHYCGDDNKFKCDVKGLLCIERDRWTPKQDAPEMNVESIENRDKMLIEKIGSAAMLEQTAEECVELAQACLKYARALRQENPTPKPFHEILANLEEETADVCLCLSELSRNSVINDTNVQHWTEIKENRIQERFKDDKTNTRGN